MKILILGLNYAPEKVGIAIYTTGMAEFLAKKGHKVEVVCGQPYYPAWRIMDGYKAWKYKSSNEKNVKITRVPHYIPANPSGMKRILHYISFAFFAFFPMLAKAIKSKPDIIITIAPSLIASPIARFAALTSGAKSWLHIQDFEVEAAFATGLLKSDNLIARLALWFENKTINSFDRISTISQKMCEKLHKKGVASDKIVEFRNWSDIDAIKPLNTPSPFRKKWNITSKHVALYSGNIANKQGIHIVVEAAKILEQRSDITFVICGEGPNREQLEKQAKDLSNIQFHNLQPLEKLNDLLGLATIHLLPQLAQAADLVLPSKLANMLASGRPIVASAAKGAGLANEVEGCGIITPPEDEIAFVKAIEMLMDNDVLCQKLGEEARIRAKKNWVKENILGDFEKMLFIDVKTNIEADKSHA